MFQGMAVVAMSRDTGSPWVLGAAKAMGLVPKYARVDPGRVVGSSEQGARVWVGGWVGGGDAAGWM